MSAEVTPFVAQTITGTIIVTAAASSAGGAVPYLTPQQYGSPGPAATLADAQAGPAQVAYIVKALSAAAANLAAGSGPTDVYLSPGYWLAIGANNTYGWGGIPIPPGVSLYGAGVGQTYVTWNRDTWGYEAFGVGKNSSLHDLSFTAPANLNATPIQTLSQATAVAVSANAYIYNVDCTLGASVNCNTGGVGTTGAIFNNITVDGCAPWAALTQEIVYGQTYDTLACTPLQTALSSGTQIYLYSYPTSGTRAEVLKGAVMQSCYLSAAAAEGATSLTVTPFVAGHGGTENASLLPGASLPSGSLVQTIINGTGIALTGGYENWSTAPPVAGNPNWNIGAVIRNCVSINNSAADIFINMGYEALMENCYGSIGHDMNFDFEFCRKSIMQNNEGHFGGNRGCAVESINSECQVLNNDIQDTLADGIRITNDGGFIPANNPYNLGGHTVAGNKVLRCGRGIAIQAAPSTIDGNVVQFCGIGVWLNNLSSHSTVTPHQNGDTVLTNNTVTYNYDYGVAVSNSDSITVGEGNEIAFNGYLGTVAPNRAAPVLSSEAVASSSLQAGTGYAIAYGYGAAVLMSGKQQTVFTASGLPAFFTPTASGQGAAFDVSLPDGVDMIEVRCSSEPTMVSPGNNGLTGYPVPSQNWMDNAILSGPQVLGHVDRAGTVTYATPNTSGFSATVNNDGSLHIVVTSPGSGPFSYMFGRGAGVFFSTFTGGVGDITIGGTSCSIHDNGYAGIWGAADPVTLDNITIANHTAVGVWRGGWNSTPASALTINGAYYGLWAPENGAGATLSALSISHCVEAIHVDGSQGQGYTLENSAISDCSVGVFITYQCMNPGDSWTIQDTAFTNVTTPVDLDGNPKDVLTIGSGNTGIPAA